MYIHKERQMTRMVRKQIYIEDAQDRLLKRFAGATGRSEADLIRESLVSHLIGLEQASERQEAWERTVQRMNVVSGATAHRTGDERPASRGWTRDELYGD